MSQERTKRSQPAHDELYELRSLLLNGDPEQVLNPDISPEAVGQVLPAAILAAEKQQSNILSSAAVSTVESAIHTSVHQNSTVLAESLFPIIGPATRKSIVAAIGNLIQSLNQALEHSLSWKSLQWRLEARRTGKSFAEVVLLRTLIYQVEQVFLIHKETGLVLQHIGSDTASEQDPDMVSAMLTAIQDFVKDSFNVGEGASLGGLDFGDLRIWLDEGPHTMLACVIRGNAPQTLHLTMQTAQEQIQQLFGPALKSFNGDAAIFEPSRLYLQACCQSQFKKSAPRNQTPFVFTRKHKWSGGLVVGCLLLGLLTWMLLSRQAHLRWTDYITVLNKEPGIVVVSHHTKQGRYVLNGLRDPLAEDPLALLENANINAAKVDMTWQPYLSLDEAFLSHRLQALLNPPPTVTMTLDEAGILRLSGTASAQWIEWARATCDRIDGINGWDSRLLIPVEWPSSWSTDNRAKPDRHPVYFNAD
ncbi:MAG: hypothetical protein AB8B99_05525 [Phormidesmis sp.]